MDDRVIQPIFEYLGLQLTPAKDHVNTILQGFVLLLRFNRDDLDTLIIHYRFKNQSSPAYTIFYSIFHCNYIAYRNSI